MQELSILDVWKKVFRYPSYIILIFMTFILFYLLNVVIVQWKNLHFVSIQYLFIIIFQGFYENVTKNTFYSTLVIGLFTGVLVSLLAFKYNRTKQMRVEKLSFLASIGLFLGVIAPGCTSCGIGLAAALGLTSTLISLPFKGIEISLLAMLFILISIYSVSKSLTKTAVCKIK